MPKEFRTLTPALRGPAQCEQEKPKMQFDCCLEDLTVQVSQIGEVASALMLRLAPYARAESPTDKEPCAPEPELPEKLHAIRAQMMTLRHITKNLESLCNRLEL